MDDPFILAALLLFLMLYLGAIFDRPRRRK
jgi:hypothetical protein